MDHVQLPSDDSCQSSPAESFAGLPVNEENLCRRIREGDNRHRNTYTPLDIPKQGILGDLVLVFVSKKSASLAGPSDDS